jgi:hypothetical protein
MIIRKLVAVFLLILYSGVARAENEEPDWSSALENYLSVVGGAVDVASEKSPTKVTVTIEQAKVLENWKFFQKVGMLNQDFDQAYINTHKNLVTMVVSMGGLMGAIIKEYKTTKIDKATFYANLRVIDMYGQEQKQVLYSFSFDRALFNKINWMNFQAANL